LVGKKVLAFERSLALSQKWKFFEK
jgi:hypothetical protein